MKFIVSTYLDGLERATFSTTESEAGRIKVLWEEIDRLSLLALESAQLGLQYGMILQALEISRLEEEMAGLFPGKYKRIYRLEVRPETRPPQRVA